MCNQDSIEGRLTLEVVDSLLIADGYQAASGIGMFAATHGLLGSIPAELAELAKDMLAAT